MPLQVLHCASGVWKKGNQQVVAVLAGRRGNWPPWAKRRAQAASSKLPRPCSSKAALPGLHGASDAGHQVLHALVDPPSW